MDDSIRSAYTVGAMDVHSSITHVEDDDIDLLEMQTYKIKLHLSESSIIQKQVLLNQSKKFFKNHTSYCKKYNSHR